MELVHSEICELGQLPYAAFHNQETLQPTLNLQNDCKYSQHLWPLLLTWFNFNSNMDK